MGAEMGEYRTAVGEVAVGVVDQRACRRMIDDLGVGSVRRTDREEIRTDTDKAPVVEHDQILSVPEISDRVDVALAVKRAVVEGKPVLAEAACEDVVALPADEAVVAGTADQAIMA